ncbi:cytochrome ubiquinol oxidase subunit II [Alicyclobacillus cycloheptanicus]|nr:cytochrome ubiquinol oxidase subunit II [Alicyclobacillus cycloheptanicus]
MVGKGRFLRYARLAIPTLAGTTLLSGCGRQFMVLDPSGPVGTRELHLILLSAGLMAVVIVPALVLFAWILVRYRDKPGNKARFAPNWAENRTLEVIWWGIPIVLIAVIGVFTAKDIYALTKPPEKNVQPLTIDVVSLDWKWLFLYPGQHIATVNYAEIPTGVPVQFVLTSDAPMNSFWVPALGGQVYTMPGMAMKLWLQADKDGDYYGHGANFTGAGFAKMQFDILSRPKADFDQWVTKVQSGTAKLTDAGYARLKKPSNVGEQSYAAFPSGLFNKIVTTDGGKYYTQMNMQDMPGMAN